MKRKTMHIVNAALMAAVICVITMLIKIPSPFKGYLNLGDAAVLISGWILSPIYGFLASAVGSMLADVFSGYAVYAPATFVIKGITSLLAFYVFKLTKKTGEAPARLISGLTAELFMVIGYFVFEGFLYGFAPSAVNIPVNSVQGGVCLILSIVLIKIFQKIKIKF